MTPSASHSIVAPPKSRNACRWPSSQPASWHRKRPPWRHDRGHERHGPARSGVQRISRVQHLAHRTQRLPRRLVRHVDVDDLPERAVEEAVRADAEDPAAPHDGRAVRRSASRRPECRAAAPRSPRSASRPRWSCTGIRSPLSASGARTACWRCPSSSCQLDPARQPGVGRDGVSPLRVAPRKAPGRRTASTARGVAGRGCVVARGQPDGQHQRAAEVSHDARE